MQLEGAHGRRDERLPERRQAQGAAVHHAHQGLRGRERAALTLGIHLAQITSVEVVTLLKKQSASLYFKHSKAITSLRTPTHWSVKLVY